MSVLRRATLVCALAALSVPAGTEVLLARVDDPVAAEALRQDAVLSKQALAVRAALDGAREAAGARDRDLLSGIRSHYEARGHKPIWYIDGEPSRQAEALRQRMEQADIDGLDPALYVADLPPSNNPEATARAEIALSLAAARFVDHLAAGRLQPGEISRLITLEPERPDAAAVLAALAGASDIDAAIAAFEPTHRDYHALKAKLSELRASDDDEERIVIPEGRLLKPGAADERVALLRQRLAAQMPEGDAELDIYDEALVTAIRAFQTENGLNADGIVGPRTLMALNGRSREEDIAALIANMERWRWMPRNLGAFHVRVNVPEFVARVVDDELVIHETRVIVGKPRNPTPTFSHAIDHLVVNPYWNVPTSILRNEMLPQIRRNPYGYFARHGYQVRVRHRGKMHIINPARIDWHRVDPRAVRVRQVPGRSNALGRIKFMFPNQHAVYLHDTPTKPLFKKDRRAFSHGCVRVDKPLEFADAILPMAAPDWHSGRLEKLYGGKERRINLDTPVPVHLGYFTISVDADGTLRRFEDIYGYDGQMTQHLGS